MGNTKTEHQFYILYTISTTTYRFRLYDFHKSTIFTTRETGRRSKKCRTTSSVAPTSQSLTAISQLSRCDKNKIIISDEQCTCATECSRPATDFWPHCTRKRRANHLQPSSLAPPSFSPLTDCRAPYDRPSHVTL